MIEFIDAARQDVVEITISIVTAKPGESGITTFVKSFPRPSTIKEVMNFIQKTLSDIKVPI